MAETGNYYLDTFGTPDIGAPPLAFVPDEAPKATGNYYLDKFGKPEFEALKPVAPEGDYGWGITTAFKRGFERLRSLPDVAQGDYEELASHFEKMEQYDLSPEDQKRMQELQNTEGWWDAAAYYFKNPALIGQVVAESLPMSAAPLALGVAGGVAGTAVGGPVGAVVGTMAGAGTGSFVTEYLASVTDYFGRQGIDVTDPEQLKQAFENNQLMGEVREFAVDRGIPIAVFDALSFGLAGRIYKPVSALTKSAAGKVAGATAEVSMQAGAGMGGEATAQLSSVGEIEDIPGVIAEGFGEIVPGLAEQSANAYMRGRQKQTTEDNLTSQLQKDLTDEEFDRLDTGEDVLSMQASMMGPVKEQIQTRQFQEMAEARALEDESVAAAEAGAEVALREDAQRSQDFLRMERDRDTRIEGQRREAEFQQEMQKGQAAVDLGVTMEDVEEAKGPLPGVSVGEALVEAGVAKPTEVSEVTEKPKLAEVTKLAKPKTKKTDEKLIKLVGEQTTAQAEFESKPNLNARRRLKKATAAVKDYVKQKAAPAKKIVMKETPVETVPVEEGIPTTPELEAEVKEAATSPKNDLPQPTKAQKEAGNYKMAHIEIKGLPITIENPVGSMRRGFKMKDHYGYVKRTEGADGDQVDVFVNPNIQTDFDNKVFVIDQTKEDGVTFDEHKAMLGYNNQLDAVRAYKRNYEKGWRVGPVTEMTVPEFKRWLAGETKTAIQGKPSRQARKFVRTKKGLRYSIPKARKALQDDARAQVPGVDREWIEKVIGKPVGKISDPAVQKMVSQIIRLQDQKAVPFSQIPLTERDVQSAVTKEIVRLNKLFPNAKIRLVNRKDVAVELEDAIQKDLVEKINTATVAALYDASSDGIYVFKTHALTVSSARRLALHEMFHKGLTRTLSTHKQYAEVMEDFYANMPAEHKVRLKKIMFEYGLDKTVAEDRQLGAEEVLANLAETEPEHSWVRKVVAVIRKILTKLRIINPQDKWTDADIAALIAEAHGALARNRKPISDITFTEEVQVEETGEVFDVETNAEVALRQHDKRTEVVEKLRACL